MEKCNGPLYNVVSIIASHSEKMFKMINEWQGAVIQMEIDDSVITNSDQELCLCDIPQAEDTTESMI